MISLQNAEMDLTGEISTRPGCSKLGQGPSQALGATLATGGATYAVGDTVVLNVSGSTANPIVMVTAISGGGGTGPATAVSLVSAGAAIVGGTYGQASTSGSGLGITITLTARVQPVHSIFLLNDVVSVPSVQLYVVGAGTIVYNGVTGALIDYGYSGNPLTGTVYRLSGESVPCLILADTLKMSKIFSDGTVYQLGITPDPDATNATVLPPLTSPIVPFSGTSTGITVTGASSSGYASVASISSIVRASNVVTVTISSPLSLSVGEPIQIASTDISFRGTYTISSIVVPGTEFTYAQFGPADTSSGGSVYLGFEAVANSGALVQIQAVGGPTGSGTDWTLNEFDGSGIVSPLTDTINLWVLIDNPANVTSFDLYFDIDPRSFSGGVVTGFAFNENYYYASVYSQLAQSGGNWTLVSVPKSSFYRVGTNPALGWSAVYAIQIVVQSVAGQTPTTTLVDLYISGGGPDSSTGVGYDYRDTYYDSLGLSESNPSPIESADVFPFDQPVGLLPGALTTNPQPDQIRYWRRGGTLSAAWYLVGTQDNVPPVAITRIDNFSGFSGAGYFVITTSVPHGLTAATSAIYLAGVTNAAYDGFWPILSIPSAIVVECYLPALNPPVVGSLGGTLAPACIDLNTDIDIASAPTLSLLNDVPVTTVAPDGTTIYGQPLSRISDPYNGTTIIGVNDPNAPGNAYWCNSGNPDGWGSINFVEVTQPNQPLLNAIFWAGTPWVRSTESLYQGFPQPIGSGFFIFSDVGAGESLAVPWGLLGGSSVPFMPWIGKSGIFIGAGGAGQSITDDRLWKLFNDDGGGNFSDRVNWGAPYFNRLAFFDHHLRWTYPGTDSTQRTYIYDIERKYWSGPFITPFGTTIEYNVPLAPEQLVMGGMDGGLYQLDFALSADNGVPIAVSVNSPVYKPGNFLDDNEYGVIGVDCTAPVGGITVQASFGNTLTGFTSIGACTNTSRSVTPFSLGDTYSNGIALIFQWTGAGTLYAYDLFWRPDGQPTSHSEVPGTLYGEQGFQHAYRAQVTLRSSGVVNLNVWADNVLITPVPQIPATGLSTKKILMAYFPRNKGQLYRVSLDAAVSGTVFKAYGSESFIELQGWDKIQTNPVALPFVATGPG